MNYRTDEKIDSNQYNSDIDEDNRDLLIFELQDELFKIEKEKNELYFNCNNKIKELEYTIDELNNRIKLEKDINDELKKKPLSKFNNDNEALKVRTENIELKRDLEELRCKLENKDKLIENINKFSDSLQMS